MFSSQVASAQKIKLFELKKYKLESKDENKLETYKSGEVVLKTDLNYYKTKNTYYSNGTKMVVKVPSYEGLTFLIKMSFDGNSNITWTDDFEEFVTIYIDNYRGQISLNKKLIKINQYNQISLKFRVEGKKILVFNAKEKIGSVSTSHMDKVTSFTFNINKNIKIYNFMIIKDSKLENKSDVKDTNNTKK
jgi:hypothetical protein